MLVYFETVYDPHLTNEYRKDGDDFVKFILKETKMKVVDKVPLTGPLLAEATRMFVDAFNSGRRLVIRTMAMFSVLAENVTT